MFTRDEYGGSATKLLCHGVNFDQLDGNGTAFQQGDDCVADESGYTVQDCDCSDPENYSFVDIGRFLRPNESYCMTHIVSVISIYTRQL